MIRLLSNNLRAMQAFPWILKITFGLGVTLGSVALSANVDDPWFGGIALAEASNKKHVSIVFAGQNLRSPISIFGHTFLVFHDSKEPGIDSPVIEYLAQTPSGIVDTLAATFGTIPGEFRLSRLAYKLREYDLEDRDLWIYTLDPAKVDPTEIVDRFRKSLAAPPRYNFFGANCGFHVMRLVVANSKENFPSLSLYTIPLETLRDLRRAGWILGTQHLPASLELAEAAMARASRQEREEVHSVLKGASSSKPNPALGLVLNYQIPREGSAELRANLAQEKKGSPDSDIKLPAVDPSLRSRSAYLQVGWQPPAHYFYLTVRLAAHDFYSVDDGLLAFSRLELLKVQIATDAQHVAPGEINLFKMESLIPSGYLRRGFVRYLDLSYYNWRMLHGRLDELPLRFGIGWSVALGRLQLAAMPYVGVRLYDFYNVRFAGVLAARLYARFQLARWCRILATYQFEPFSPIGFRHLLNFEAVPFERQRWGLFTGFSVTEVSLPRVFVGVTVFF